MLISIDVIDVELNHRRVHLSGLRESDGSTMQSFQVRPEVQVVALDVECLRLADGVPLGRQHLGIRLPVVGIKVCDRAACEFALELAA